MNCKHCNREINLKRFELGYKTCLECSTEPRFSGVPVINHKTGNEIQIVKDPEVAAEFMAKSARTGYGTLRGMSLRYKKQVVTSSKKDKIISKPVVDRELGRKQLPHEFEKVGSEVMALIEDKKIELAHKLIESAMAEKRIYKMHADRLHRIIETLTT
jgi:hypothetical protein